MTLEISSQYKILLSDLKCALLNKQVCSKSLAEKNLNLSSPSHSTRSAHVCLPAYESFSSHSKENPLLPFYGFTFTDITEACLESRRLYLCIKLLKFILTFNLRASVNFCGELKYLFFNILRKRNISSISSPFRTRKVSIWNVTIGSLEANVNSKLFWTNKY